MLKIGILSAKGIRKIALILHEGGFAPAPPKQLGIRVVLLQIVYAICSSFLPMYMDTLGTDVSIFISWILKYLYVAGSFDARRNTNKTEKPFSPT